MKDKGNVTTGFRLLPERGYFQNRGVDVMAFDDIYPEGHQSGVSIIMHGHRVATNGDIRLEQTPGQWQPVPKQLERTLDPEADRITTRLAWPDRQRHLRGFNPMIYPDFECEYTVRVEADGDAIQVTVDLDREVPDFLLGKLSFNLELFPGDLVGTPWLLDDRQGFFPEQPNGPVLTLPTNYEHTGDFAEPDARADRGVLADDGSGYSPIIADDLIAVPYATGRRFTCRPDEASRRFVIESHGTPLKLYDGRMNHNNGWFVLSSEVAAGATKGAVCWTITPTVIPDWLHAPVIQVSQVGYHPGQTKRAVIELDARDGVRLEPELVRLDETGETVVLRAAAREWGDFLRYRYLHFDFTQVTEPGIYQLRYGTSRSAWFRIGSDIYERGVWQPVLEYFLPVQMCHMRVNEKYRVWHGACHLDDARMAPVDFNHIDGYVQGPSTLCDYQPGDSVPGLNVGGWHDAGDFDLRVESQAGEAYILALAYEAFGVDYDVTTIDQERQVTEIHQPDGKNDILQQIEHGVLTVVGGWKALGRLYRGIITGRLRDYVLLGDSAAMTAGIAGDGDDRWVFTEDNPPRELLTAGQLAAAARALAGFNDELAADALAAAEELFRVTAVENEAARRAKLFAASELFLTTGAAVYRGHLLAETDYVAGALEKVGWFIARVEAQLADAGFTAAVRAGLPALRETLAGQSAATPYGIPYEPYIWGAGWGIQRLGFEYYFLHRAYPDIFDAELMYNALNFVLGCHPGSNTMSFASGVGSTSATVGYGLNRADWSYIPGGVISGTALIRPDFPELLVFPYLWQQVEYVLGGGSSHFMFLALAAGQLLAED